ncbi:MAG TPA: toll/interleukin-1 receptor domain-containing protein [Ktedonobacteraceae bacterium]|nr:toll/interleukin-1 receptor domain-containing protein [Ktedonobacteraceae bacterium]
MNHICLFPKRLRDYALAEDNLRGADLHEAKLGGANLYRADLRDTRLEGASLYSANLHGAKLEGTELSGTELIGTNLSDAELIGTDLSGAIFFGTIFANLDLRKTKGLAEIEHWGPSVIHLHTVHLPQNDSALHFLRGAGVPDEWIDFWRIHMMHPIQYHSLFISYSNKDEMLAHRLHTDLQASGVRCWFAPEDLQIGNKFRQRIDEAIHQQDKLLLLLSEHSIKSLWVENEVEAALEKEDRQQCEVLFPIRLDDTVMQTSQAWAATLRRTRHIGDFTNWTDLQAYQSAFDRLLRDLMLMDNINNLWREITLADQAGIA